MKDPVSEPDPGWNSSDDRMISVSEDHSDDPGEEEIALMFDLSCAEFWMGRL